METKHIILGAGGLAGGLVLWRLWRRRPIEIAVGEPVGAAEVAPTSGGSGAVGGGVTRQPTPSNGRRVSRSRVDDSSTVIETPAELLAQARRFDPQLTLDEYTGARLAASEHGSGSIEELAAIIDSERNRAEAHGKSLFESLTWKGTFGKQGRRRPASTRLDPNERHLAAARAVLRSGEIRGISRGATRFFDPRAQAALARAGKACPPLVILERWAFDYPWSDRSRCELDRRKPGHETLAWIGEVAGIDPSRLLLMRPAELGEEHTARYRTVIEALLLADKPIA